MRDLKLFVLGLSLFMIPTLLAKTTDPLLYPKPKVEHIQEKTKDKKDKQVACFSINRLCFYSLCYEIDVPFRCVGGGVGGGGGSAF